MRKKTNKNRNKARRQILENIHTNLFDKLAELAKGLTPKEIVKAHVQFYGTCNIVQQGILREHFKAEEDKELTELARS